MLLLNQTSFIDNKILNKEYFGTFYIRSLRVDNKKIYILDNNYLQFNSSVLEINKFLFLKKEKLGCSLKVGIYDYKNNLNNAITFKSYILSSQFFCFHLCCISIYIFPEIFSTKKRSSVILVTYKKILKICRKSNF